MSARAPTPSRRADDELPLDVAQVLDEEYRVLYATDPGPPPPPLPGWLLAEDQLVRPERFVERLRQPTAVAHYFVSRLPAETRQSLETTAASGGPSLAAVVRDLNGLLAAGRVLYNATSLPDLRLGGDVRALTEMPLAEADLVHVNRLLLEQAFPGEITRIYDIRLRALYERVHARGNDAACGPRTALCLSGGGIRSATFGLGLLQGLARLNYLDRFDYLSTVSGGGYVGAWLTSWIHRHPAGTPGVMTELGEAVARSPVTPEPKPIHHLREYSNYLSPKLGLFSADTWTLIATYLRNVLLNWTVLVPLLLGGLAVPRLIVSLTLADPGKAWRGATLAGGLVALLLAVVYIGVFRPSHEESRRWLPPWLRHQGRQDAFLALCLVPLLLSAIALTLYWAWWSDPAPPLSGWPFVGLLALLGAGLHAAAWAAHSVLLRRADPRELIVSGATGGFAGFLVGLGITRLLPAAPVWSFVEYYVPLAVPGFIVAFLLAATVFVGLVSHRTSDEDREWWARLGAWTLITAVTWLLGCALVVLGPPALAYSWTLLASWLSIGTISGAIAVLLGRSGNTSGAGQGTTARAASPLMDHVATIAAPVALAVLFVLLSRATTAMLPAVTRCQNWPVIQPPFPMLPDPIDHGEVLHCTPAWVLGAWIVGLLVVAHTASRFINVNKFSLHAMYRARLIRAYLGASRDRRSPNPFTGFDPLDNIQMHELRDEAFNPGSFKDAAAFVERLHTPPPGDAVSRMLRSLLPGVTRSMIDAHPPGTEPSGTLERRLLEDLNRILDTEPLERDPAFAALAPTAGPLVTVAGHHRSWRNRALLEAAYPTEIARRPPPPRKPLHVLNMALNLVAGHNLAWQERKAETFTVTELHAGSYHLGYRRSCDYGGTDPRGISLGTAVAVSGAAASPNMGYHSSPLVTFLMAMFNARLGWWLGNPGPRGQRTFPRGSPGVGVWPMLREALGLTDDEYKYVYLSDGGHFDNLGLLEMVLRRCHLIVVSDAGHDPHCTFEDLGNAIRKVRIDLGVPIILREQMRIRPRVADGRASGVEDGAYFAVADIKYTDVEPDGKDGVLIYLKPCFYGGEPIDVVNYALAHRAFPHEPTSDQYFSESQFESYRQLGLHTIMTAWRVGAA